MFKNSLNNVPLPRFLGQVKRITALGKIIQMTEKDRGTQYSARTACDHFMSFLFFLGMKTPNSSPEEKFVTFVNSINSFHLRISIVNDKENLLSFQK